MDKESSPEIAERHCIWIKKKLAEVKAQDNDKNEIDMARAIHMRAHPKYIEKQERKNITDGRRT